MLRVLVFLAAVFVAALSAAWLADQPGSIRYELLGRSGSLSTSEAVVVLVVALAVAVVALELVRALLRMPRRLAERAEERRRARAFEALSDGLVAVAAGDLRTAERAAAEAERTAPDAPLTRLLAAQAAQLAGRPDAAQDRFAAMTGDERTFTLGLRGLYVEATRAGDAEAARQHARAANAADPALPWAATAAFDAATAERDWAGALALLEDAHKNRLVDRATYRRRKAVLLVAEAAEEASDAPDAARRKAVEAHGLAKDLVPAAVLAARLVAPRARRQAIAILEETWKAAPHPEIFSAALAAFPAESAADRLKRAEALAAMRPGHVESALGLSATARAARDFDKARAALRPFAAERPSQRVCIAMAEIEAADTGDEGRVREWLARAVRAPRDPAWLADGVVSGEWGPISPVTGRLDAFEWRVPDAAAHPGPAIDLTALTPARLAPPEAPHQEALEEEPQSGPSDEATADDRQK
jgi:HemY protein